MMAVQIIPERSYRGPGCTDACYIIEVLIPGVFGRSDLVLHDVPSHEAYGRRQASGGVDSDGDIVVTGVLRVNLRSLEVCVEGNPVQLTATELKILMHLARRVGGAYTYEEMLTALWREDRARPDSLHLVRVNIARLRRRLGPAGSLIVTIPGVGHRLDAIQPGETRPLRPVQILRPGQWAIKWDRCRGCGTTEFPHRAHGYCSRVACGRLARRQQRGEWRIGGTS